MQQLTIWHGSKAAIIVGLEILIRMENKMNEKEFDVEYPIGDGDMMKQIITSILTDTRTTFVEFEVNDE